MNCQVDFDMPQPARGKNFSKIDFEFRPLFWKYSFSINDLTPILPRIWPSYPWSPWHLATSQLWCKKYCKIWLFEIHQNYIEMEMGAKQRNVYLMVGAFFPGIRTRNITWCHVSTVAKYFPSSAMTFIIGPHICLKRRSHITAQSVYLSKDSFTRKSC